MKFKPIQKIKTGELAHYGGKASGLALLHECDLAIPKALAFDNREIFAFLENNLALNDKLAALSKWGGEEPLDSQLVALPSAIKNLAPPAGWPVTAQNIFLALGPRVSALAVRSNMNVEDAAQTSFAGCFVSRAPVEKSETALWRAMAEVLASAFTEAAIRRMLESGVSPRAFRPGVLIQEYIKANTGGVSFSRKPSRFWSFSPHLEWSTDGGPEAVVSGRAAVKVHDSDDQTPDDLKSYAPALFKALRLLETKTESAYETEWLINDGKIVFLQARAIAADWNFMTPLFESGVVLDRQLSQERFPNRISPLGWTALQDLLEVNSRSLHSRFGIEIKDPNKLALCFRGWVYANTSAFDYPGNLRFKIFKTLKPKRLARLAGVIFAGLLRLLSMRAKNFGPWMKYQVVRAFVIGEAEDLRRSWQKHVTTFNKNLEDFYRNRVTGSIGDYEQLRKISVDLLEPDFAIFLIREIFFKAVSGWARINGVNDNELIAQLNLGHSNKTSEAMAAARALESGELSFEKFNDHFGDITMSWDLRVPTLGEEASKRRALSTSTISREPVSRSAAPVTSSKSSNHLPAGDLALLRDIANIDEDLHFYSGRLIGASRSLVLKSAALMVERGELDDVDAIFFLTLAELKNHLRDRPFNPRLLARSRRAIWLRDEQSALMPVLPATLAPVERHGGSPGLNGLGSSCGVARGPVYILENIEKMMDVPEGVILVTYSPNPALACLYSRLRGMISESGGALSHGMVAAREARLPAVCGVAGAVSAMRVAKNAIVDSDQGTIFVSED